MKTRLEWAQYYFNKGIDIWIPNVAFQWENYQKHEQTLAEIMSYNWKQANAIYGVAGKQGIRLISFNVKDIDKNVIRILVDKSLETLGLHAYPWVIKNQDEISIIVDCPNINKEDIESFDIFSILYRGVFSLPSFKGYSQPPSDQSVKFFFNAIPTIRPAYVHKNRFNDLMDIYKNGIDSIIAKNSRMCKNHETCIGYYINDYGHDYIVDHHKVRHSISRGDLKVTLKQFQFVTFEWDGYKAYDITPLEEYPLFDNCQESSKKFCLKRSNYGETIYLINKEGIKYSLDGAEKFIVKRIFDKKSLLPSILQSITEKEFQVELIKIFQIVDKVSIHLQDIADSYKVELKGWHISRPGRDDISGVNREISKTYSDVYVDKFFSIKDCVYRDISYCVETGFKDYRDLRQEEIDKNNFLNNYNKKDHFMSLLYDLYRKNGNLSLIEDDILFSAYWGITLKVSKDSYSSWPRFQLSDITYYDQHSGMRKS